VLMLVVWWVVSGSLAPVARVQRQVASRQADDLSEVSEADLPDEVRPLVQELNLLFSRVRTAFEAQQNFVADAAHELRTPLAALKLQILSLERADCNDAREVAIARLTAGVERAARLVEQLLVLARQEAAEAKLEPVSLTELARRAVGDMAGAAQAREIDLGLERADEATVQGQGDALLIMLRNLVDNAVKYTPAGGTVDVSVLGQGGGAQLVVEDSGPGIPPEERERVFNRFYRVPGSVALCRSAMDASERLGGLKVTVTFAAS